MPNLVLTLAEKISNLIPNSLRRGLYRLGPLTRAIRGTLNRAAPEGLTKVRVAAGPLKGSDFHLDLQFEKDLWLGTYETPLLNLLPSLISPGAIVYDVGANLGYLTVAFGRLVGAEGSVHAFEPLPANVKRLQRSIKDNDLDERVMVVEAAVADKSGKATFLVHRSGGMGKLEGSWGRQARYPQRIETKVLALDQYIEQGEHVPPQWVKVDVEGGEGAVLRGAGDLLRAARPSWLIEIHGPEAAADVWEQLEAADYLLYSVARPGHRVASLAELDWKAYLMALPQESQGIGRDG